MSFLTCSWFSKLKQLLDACQESLEADLVVCELGGDRQERPNHLKVFTAHSNVSIQIELLGFCDEEQYGTDDCCHGLCPLWVLTFVDLAHVVEECAKL